MSSDHLTRLVGSGSNWDSIVSQGLLFKMTATQLTILTSVFTIAFAFLVARLFRVFCLVTFCMFIRQGSNEYQTDQVRVAVVNFRMPLHVIGQRFSWGRVAKGKGRVRIFALVWLAGAVVSLLLGLSIPVLISRLPVANGVAGGPNCALGLIPIDQGNLRSRTLFDAHLRYEQQNALVHTDATGYDYEGFSEAQVGYLKPRDTIEKSAVCPNHSTTTTCADGDALNFFGEYWLEPSDLGVGNIDDLRFGVSTQCYKVIEAVEELAPRPNVTEAFTRYGLFYGPNSNLADSVNPNLTEIIRREENNGKRYNVHAYWSPHQDSSVEGDRRLWIPREDLRHEGDLSLLIYHLGATYALEHGEDPLFGTIPLNTSGKVASNWIDENQEHVKEWNGHFLFKPASQTVTVVCNTTYILCDSHLIPTTHGYCRRFGGYEELLALIIGLQEGTIPRAEADPSRQGFVELLVDIVHYSSMDFSAVAVNGVFANNHLLWDLDHQFDLKIQRFLDQISGHRELTRLFLSTRMRFLLAARRAVLQEWLVPLQQQGSDYGDVMRSMLPPNENTSAMCKATLVPDSNYKTTTARPWIVVALVWLAVVLITYSAPLVLMFHWKWAEDIEREWVARKVGNLHKRLQQGQPIDSEIRPRDLKSGKEATNMPPLLGNEEVSSSA